jgi:hypothetical protein
MKNNIITLLTVILLSIVFTGYSKSEINDNSSKTIDDLIQFFSTDFKIDGKHEKYFAMVGAIDGCSINLDGSGVEIYKYDLTDPGQKTIINEAKNKNTLPCFGMALPCIVNGSFILVNYTSHPKKDKVIKKFKNFK